MDDVVFEGSGFSLRRLTVGPLDNNVYLLTDGGSGSGVLIDAADEPGRILRFIGDTRVEAVLTTHGHWDHHQAIPAVSDSLGVPFMLHPLDAPLAGKTPDNDLVAGPFAVGDTTIEILHTPGHTPGAVCIAAEGAVVTGDTLFPGGPGATRFEHSSFPTIIQSICSQLFTLPDDTMVFPGHGAETTIGTERPHLEEWIERGW